MAAFKKKFQLKLGGGGGGDGSDDEQKSQPIQPP